MMMLAGLFLRAVPYYHHLLIPMEKECSVILKMRPLTLFIHCQHCPDNLGTKSEPVRVVLILPKDWGDLHLCVDVHTLGAEDHYGEHWTYGLLIQNCYCS